jgi:hypothetical protein
MIATTRTATTKYGVSLTIFNPPADEARVVALETRLGTRLPEEYRQFLLDFNGGRPSPACFKLALRAGPYTDSMVDWFLSVHVADKSNIDTVLGWLENRKPPVLLPIAIDPGGNIVMLGIKGDVRGKVYFWHQDYEPGNDHDWSNIDLIADSFDAFMSGLKPNDGPSS